MRSSEFALSVFLIAFFVGCSSLKDETRRVSDLACYESFISFKEWGMTMEDFHTNDTLVRTQEEAYVVDSVMINNIFLISLYNVPNDSLLDSQLYYLEDIPVESYYSPVRAADDPNTILDSNLICVFELKELDP